ncbi:MAG: hypothetical protein ABI480_08815 [Chitinophagaceae bacterium]
MRKLYSHVLNKYVLSSCFLIPLFFPTRISTAANNGAAHSIGYAGLTAASYTVMVVGTSGDVTSPPAVLTLKIQRPSLYRGIRKMERKFISITNCFRFN